MQEDRFVKAKRAEGRVAEGGWRPGLGPLVGVVLCLIALLAVIILGVTTGIGIVLAVPLGVVIVAAALVLLRWTPGRAGVSCPNCGARVGVPEHITEFDCPACGTRLERVGGVVRRVA
jgi:DNA-directed RNA polymerase subunit RPC12/RpoP